MASEGRNFSLITSNHDLASISNGITFGIMQRKITKTVQTMYIVQKFEWE